MIFHASKAAKMFLHVLTICLGPMLSLSSPLNPLSHLNQQAASCNTGFLCLSHQNGRLVSLTKYRSSNHSFLGLLQGRSQQIQATRSPPGLLPVSSSSFNTSGHRVAFAAAAMAATVAMAVPAVPVPYL